MLIDFGVILGLATLEMKESGARARARARPAACCQLSECDHTRTKLIIKLLDWPGGGPVPYTSYLQGCKVSVLGWP